ncbi:MAG: PaaI family thioesterase [Rikenellaceae bacterium]|jgi:acyl-CoA thioesterase|nr:PaaI family thioesterase [Rikenellaceae bacterium]
MTIYEFFRNDRFAALAGVELSDVRPGYARATMTVTPDHLNAGGTVQGGAIFTLADLAFAAAVNAYGNLAVSIQSSIYFHRGLSSGVLAAEAKAIKVGASIASFEATVTDEAGETVATFVASAYRKDVTLPFAKP